MFEDGRGDSVVCVCVREYVSYAFDFTQSHQYQPCRIAAFYSARLSDVNQSSHAVICSVEIYLPYHSFQRIVQHRKATYIYIYIYSLLFTFLRLESAMIFAIHSTLILFRADRKRETTTTSQMASVCDWKFHHRKTQSSILLTKIED